MGQLVLVIGSPGTGKSFSGRNLKSVTWANSSPTMKPFTWRTSEKMIYTTDSNMNQIDLLCTILKNAKTKNVILDDIGYAFFAGYAEDTFDPKYSYGRHSINLVSNMNRVLRESAKCGKNVIFMLHPEQLDFNKVLKDKFSFDGCFSVVCNSVKNQGEYYFDIATPPAKSPYGMFETEIIPNDLTIVLKAMYDYYGRPEKASDSVLSDSVYSMESDNNENKDIVDNAEKEEVIF